MAMTRVKCIDLSRGSSRFSCKRAGEIHTVEGNVLRSSVSFSSLALGLHGLQLRPLHFGLVFLGGLYYRRSYLWMIPAYHHMVWGV
jgi:hypothetical protein